MEHVDYKCSCHRAGCMFCDGGLFKCTICDSFEGATTTHCPGAAMSQEQIDAVYAGTLDFRDGAWVDAPSGSCSSHFDGRPGLPENRVSAMEEKILDDHLWRIDAIPDVSGTMKAIEQLAPGVRRAVILRALRYSRFQFQWSFAAQKHGIPESDWPEREN